ncbi:amylo-alpha-1,6-glucosidase [Wenyingzhuangia sp. 2_MG-2023]|uniref:amylo-alpha-1,6-glucosidase n=1 Tax=Wenyingzhuangia sp. 2_MG-2023 TaxID=3062639 RepID=UPI0026E1D48B|nr:amylo-alpha-1,6-glucosidase [Wenyingzhuangia sp. 2_MG-2023]MDO6737843.1 amylo-alpha-1,6-glucosidase [Wenyingzhuangia sp. 2_MG-2023]
MKTSDKEIGELLNLEWLETNGIGGYASSSITGANTRKYHGLLVAPFNPPTDRKNLVGKIEERILLDDVYSDLSVNQYPNIIHPTGQQYLTEFTRRPFATWQYQSDHWKLKKQLFMVHGSNTTVLTYENTGTNTFELELHPLWEFKDYHGNFTKNSHHFEYQKNENHIEVTLSKEINPVYWDWSQGKFIEKRAWYKNFQLSKENYRGERDQEDLYRIGYITCALAPGQKIKISFTTDAKMVGREYQKLEEKTLKHLKKLKSKETKNVFYNDLLISGDQFIVKRNSTKSKTIIAGYHWFTDWGRDTMIAMRGLTIATGDQKTTKSLLSTFLKYVDKGMLPNRFPDFSKQEIEYNTIDATLWMFIALYEYRQKFDDLAFVQLHIKKLEKILTTHIKGTRYNIHTTPEGFLSGGQDGVQLTWMDALVDGYVVTPRMGCPVEINALWYNALRIFETLAKECNHPVKSNISKVLKKITTNFKTYFLNENGYLNDVVVPNKTVDSSFRSNQIYVVSLPFSLLTLKEEKKIVKMVEEKLLTDFGLRTLDPNDSNYKGHYGGNKWERDTAYHQGTVWTFILMDYWEAYLKTHKKSEAAKKKVLRALQPLQDHFYHQNGLHTISEIFDGDHPFDGRGCIQQAWSVAALIKLYSDYKLYKIA